MSTCTAIYVDPETQCTEKTQSIHGNWVWKFPDECLQITFTQNVITNIGTSRMACGFVVSIPGKTDLITGFFTQNGKLYIYSDTSFKYCAYQIGPKTLSGYPMRSQDGSTNSLLIPV